MSFDKTMCNILPDCRRMQAPLNATDPSGQMQILDIHVDPLTQVSPGSPQREPGPTPTEATKTQSP